MAENNYEEKKLEEVTIADLVESINILTVAVQTLNDVQLVILHNMKDLEMPDWKSLKEIEDDVAGIVKKCAEVVRRANGPSKTDKS